MPEGNNNAVPSNRLLINVDELSSLLSMSPRTIWRKLSAGQMIQPVRIGGSTRWRLDEVQAWVEAGCPHSEPSQNASGGTDRWRPSAN